MIRYYPTGLIHSELKPAASLHASVHSEQLACRYGEVQLVQLVQVVNHSIFDPSKYVRYRTDRCGVARNNHHSINAEAIDSIQEIK